MKRNVPIPFVIVFLITMFLSCVKDTDFEQADDIVLTPVYELDLIYFTLNATDFFDTITQTPRLTVTDTTQIRFLDDSFVQEDLKRAEFLFLFTNSIPRDFEVHFQFLNASMDTTYTTQTAVNAGSAKDPLQTSFLEVVEENDVPLLTLADRVVVSVTIPDADEHLRGTLNLQSKTTYFLEIQD